MKNIYRTFATLALTGTLVSQSVLPAMAQVPTGTTEVKKELMLHVVNQDSMRASRAATIQQSRLSEIISKGDSLITTRVTALQGLLTRIQNDQRLSTSEKTSLTTDIQTTITNLQNLKVKLDADTDATTALSDSKSIITSYYIFAVYQPKQELLITLNSLQSTVATLQAVVPQLQTLITTYGAGKDTTQIQNSLNDISAQLATMSSSLSTDVTTVQGVSISSESTAHTTFMQVRSDITNTIRTGFSKIQQDLVVIKPLLRHLISAGNTSTASNSGTLKTTQTTAPATHSAY